MVSADSGVARRTTRGLSHALPPSYDTAHPCVTLGPAILVFSRRVFLLFAVVYLLFLVFVFWGYGVLFEQARTARHDSRITH